MSSSQCSSTDNQGNSLAAHGNTETECAIQKQRERGPRMHDLVCDQLCGVEE